MATTTTSRRLRVIINPISGTRSKKGVAEMIERYMSARGFDVEICYTARAGHATELAADAARRDYYGVIVVGGDGTVNETACGLIGSRVALGIVPMGSGNGLARHVGIPTDVKGALRILGRDQVQDCDYATANGRPFFCTCGFGFDARVTHRFARQHRRGLMTYVRSAATEFVNYESDPYRLQVEDGQPFEQEAFLVACCNASQYGNDAFIAPKASITDGLLDITVVHKGNPLSRMLVGVELMTGLIGTNAMVDTFRTRRLVIERPEAGPAHIDGEPVDMAERIEVEIHPAQLRLFVNKRKGKLLPGIAGVTKMFEAVGSRLRSVFQKM